MDHVLRAALLRHLPESLVITDASLTIVDYLGRASLLLGWTRDEVIGKRLVDGFDQRFPDDDGEAFVRGLSEGHPARARMQVRRKDGTWCDIETVAVPLRDASARLLGWLVSVRAEQASAPVSDALVAEHASLTHVVHGANDATWDWNLETGEVLVNRRWCEMLGRHDQRLTSSVDVWATLVHPDDFARVRDGVRAHQAGETAAYEMEYRLQHAQGHWVWVLDRGKVVDRAPDGAARRMSGAFTDITPRKQTEARLEAALAENETLVRELREALQRVHTLAGLIPLCMHCKKVRDDAGYWARIEEYLTSHTGAAVTHGICPQCLEEHYPDYAR